MKKRIFLAGSSLVVWWFAFYIIKPWFGVISKPFLPAEHSLFWKHLLVFSFPTALVCGVWWMFLIYKRFMPMPLILRNFNQSFKYSTFMGIGIVLFSGPLLKFIFKYPSEFHFNLESFLGNIFSNFWEEVVYRGLLFQAFFSATGSLLLSAIVSSAIFAYTHDQYPIDLQILVGCVGIMLCWTFHKTKSLIAVSWAHNIADWILDLFF